MAATTNTAEFHRQLRSLFAVLRTLVRQTTQGRETVQDYAAHLEGRIGALAAAHEMLMRAPEEGVDLRELVLAPLLAQSVAEYQYKVDGPEIRITPTSAVPLALALHELTVNAQDYGAVRSDAGRIDVTWQPFSTNGSDWLEVLWCERGSDLDPDAPRRKGFGAELIERMLPYELAARSRIDWVAAGIRVQLLIPAVAGTVVWQVIDAGEVQ
jgi:two-component system CheB/CheR fusion protein